MNTTTSRCGFCMFAVPPDPAMMTVCCCFASQMKLLQGTLFHDKFSAKSLDTARPELIYMEKVFQQHHPGVQFQSVQ